MKGLGAVVTICAIAALAAPAAAAEYVPGMTCHEVAGFAEAVAAQMKADRLTGMAGLTLKEQISGMRQSIQGRPTTQAALEKIIRAIYSNKAFKTAAPSNVGAAFGKTCEAITR